MAFQGGRISNNMILMSSAQRMRNKRITALPKGCIGKRRLTSSRFSLGKSSFPRIAGSKPPLRQMGRQERRWSTTSSSSDISESLKIRQRQSKFIGVLSVAFAAAVLVEVNSKKGWIGKEPPITLPRVYSRQAIEDYWSQRPISIVRRLGQVVIQLGPIWVRYIGHKHSPFASKSNPHTMDVQLQEQVIRTLAKDLKEALTNLGPAWIKGMLGTFRRYAEPTSHVCVCFTLYLFCLFRNS